MGRRTVGVRVPKGPVEETSFDRFQEYARTREPALRDALVLEQLPLVERIARRYGGLGEPMEDLVQEGYIGLIKAVDQFNPKVGVKFTTYATHVVSGEIRHYLRDLGRLIKEPAWLVELRFRVNRAGDELTQRLGRSPALEEVAEQLGIGEEEVAEVASTRAIFQVASLDEGITGEEDDTGPSPLAERITDTSEEAETPFEERMVLRQSMLKLRKLEQSVIHHFFYQEYTKTEIARKLGISVNYVSYLIGRGLQNLKQILIKEERREAVLRLEFLENRLAATEGPFDSGAISDEVTKLYSKPFFRTLVEDEVTRAKRYGLEFSVLFATLAEWPQMADLMTEDEKSRVLGNLADILKRGLREVDRLAYYGQGRFAAILPHTGTDAKHASQRIAAMAKGRELRPARLKSVPSASLVCKVVTFPKDAENTDELFEAGEMLERHINPSV